MAKEPVIKVTENRKLIKTSIPLFGEWLYVFKQAKAWFTLRRFYSVMPMLKGNVGLVIDSRFATPLNPYAEYNEEELQRRTDLDMCCETAINMVANRADRESGQNVVAWTVSIIAMSLTMIVLIFGILIASKGS